MPASLYRHNLARLRKKLGLSQQDVADLAGVSAATIQSVENLRLELSDALAAKLQGALGVPDAWLLANDLESPVPKPLKIYLEPGEASHKMKYYAFSRWGMALSMLTQIGEDKARLSLFQLYTRDYLSQVAQAFGEVKVPVGFRAIEYLKRGIDSFAPTASVADLENELPLQGKRARSRNRVSA